MLDCVVTFWLYMIWYHAYNEVTMYGYNQYKLIGVSNTTYIYTLYYTGLSYALVEIFDTVEKHKRQTDRTN